MVRKIAWSRWVALTLLAGILGTGCNFGALPYFLGAGNDNRLLISADSGGSNRYRVRLWKHELA